MLIGFAYGRRPSPLIFNVGAVEQGFNRAWYQGTHGRTTGLDSVTPRSDQSPRLYRLSTHLVRPFNNSETLASRLYH